MFFIASRLSQTEIITRSSPDEPIPRPVYRATKPGCRSTNGMETSSISCASSSAMPAFGRARNMRMIMCTSRLFSPILQRLGRIDEGGTARKGRWNNVRLNSPWRTLIEQLNLGRLQKRRVRVQREEGRQDSNLERVRHDSSVGLSAAGRDLSLRVL